METKNIINNADPISHEDLNGLARRSGPVVSLFVPTHRGGPETRNDAQQLRPLLETAKAELAERYPDADAAALLAPIRALADNERFWQEQVDGLAVYSSPGGSQYFRTDVNFEPSVTVGDHPNLRPIVPIAAQDLEFYLLAVSQKKVRLFQGGRLTITELPLGSIPASVDDLEGHYTREPQLQRSASSTHGHEAGDDHVLAGFLQAVGKAAQNRFNGSNLPVVLAAVNEYHSPIARELHNGRLLDKAVAGNPDTLSAAQLHEAAWPQVAEEADRRHDANVERFAQQLGTGLASGDPASIITAAESGRVDKLLLTERGLTSPDDPANLDHALCVALQTGGSVDVVPELESNNKSGAVYRF